jgi:hypothetical protein
MNENEESIIKYYSTPKSSFDFMVYPTKIKDIGSSYSDKTYIEQATDIYSRLYPKETSINLSKLEDIYSDVTPTWREVLFGVKDKIQTIINKTKNHRLSFYSKNNKGIY